MNTNCRINDMLHLCVFLYVYYVINSMTYNIDTAHSFVPISVARW